MIDGYIWLFLLEKYTLVKYNSLGITVIGTEKMRKTQKLNIITGILKLIWKKIDEMEKRVIENRWNGENSERKL